MASLSLSDSLLSSSISLPENPVILYLKLSSSLRKPHDQIELVRRHLLSLNSSDSLLHSLLASVHITSSNPSIFIFAISSTDAARKINDLHFDYMTVTEHGSFSPGDLYACSSACSLLDSPCLKCKSLAPNAFIPRRHLRTIYSHFLEAVRIRLLDDIVKVSYRRESSVSPRKQAQRLRSGFLFGQHPALSRQTREWEYSPSFRPLVFCHLQVLLAGPLDQFPRLLIHPILMATPYLPLTQMLPLPCGTPIVLLPHGTPAYYRTTYAGPTGALVKQFREALQGLGASDWENSFGEKPEYQEGNQDPTFIIAQISVENKQGADKGVLVIYPAALCLSFVPSMANLRQPLEHMLDLPTPLQPSPQVQARTTNEQLSPVNSGPVSGTPIHFHAPPTNTSTPDSLQAFRSLTLSKHKDIHRVAEEVSGYVESVARERERERERLKREREGTSSSPRLARTTAPTPVASSATPSTDISDTATGQQPMPVPPHSFYPSPPHANSNSFIMSDMPTSPTADKSPPAADTFQDAPLTETIRTPPPVDTPQIHKSSSSSFDPFGNMDPAWSQMPQTYIGMDLDFDMTMSFGMTENGNDRETYMDMRHGMDLEDVFTDDDFNFFDQPSRNIQPDQNPAPIRQPIDPNRNRSSVPSTIAVHEVGTSPSFREGIFSGPNHGTPTPTWLQNQHTESLLPAFTDVEVKIPDLSPTSGCTPETDSGPSTPDVQIDFDMTVGNPHASLMKSPFDPIPFASYHSAADGKYLHGKFALSSPKRDEYLSEVHPSAHAKFLSDPRGWKSQYNAITDPRIGVIQKLIGAKRKLESEHSAREDKFIPSWAQGDDWIIEEKSGEERILSDEESDGEMDGSDSSNGASRPITPPPSYLPPGPSLLFTQFEHGSLLAIGTPLLSSDSATLSSTPIPISVPTPVSPAALGTATEKSKSLEAIAGALAHEVVENCLWAEAWKNVTFSHRSPREVWPADIKYASTLLTSVSTSASSLDLASLFSSQHTTNSTTQAIKPLEPPMIAIGKGETVIHVLPTALRFWEKLGLGPRGGKKNITVFTLYDKEGDGSQRELQIGSWLASMTTTYATRYYGNLKLGQNLNAIRDGHMPVKYDKSLRKTIVSFMSNLTSAEHHYVFFLVVPISLMTLASPVLRQSIAALKKALKDHENIHAIYELVPEHQVFGPLQTPSAYELSINSLCSSVYNRIPSVVYRSASRDLLESGDNQCYIEGPAFTLARPFPCKASFVREAHVPLDVMDRYTLMHVGYQLSICGKWLVAACIDQRGEAHDVGTWLTHTAEESQDAELSEEAYVVKKVWEFTLSFAKKANMEWRIAIAKYGMMNETELEAWIDHLENAVTDTRSPPLHVNILCTEAEAPWSILNAQRSATTNQASGTRVATKNSVFADVSSHTYMLRTQTRLPLSLPPHTSFCQPFILESSSDSLSTTIDSDSESNGRATEDKDQLPHPLGLLPRSSMTLIYMPSSAASIPISMLHVHLLYTTSSTHTSTSSHDYSKLHEEITYNFYELSLLAKLRWKLYTNPVLPFHLGAVELMLTALERDKDRPEAA